MTAPDIDLLSRGWSLIAQGAEMVSLAYSAASPQPQAAASGTRARVPSSAPPPDDLPPLDEEPPDTTTFAYAHELAEKVGGTVEPDYALGRCPVHGKPWTTAKAGISKKTGKPYSAFWKCSEKDGDKFCNEKPIRAWADSHPIAA
jgi:hypothetical protein